MTPRDWVNDAAQDIVKRCVKEGDRSDVAIITQIIATHCPFKQGVAYAEVTAEKVAKK